MTVNDQHPVISAMCDAFHGKAAKHKKMRRVAMLRAFQAAQEFYAAPKGYEHYTPATIEAIRGTTMTHADRQNKTQDEVFRESGR
jgi:hypothetical protein